MIVVMTGLPGTGKSTVARALARHLPGAYLSVDPIYDALLPFGIEEQDPLGKSPYAVVRRLAAIQATLGLSAVVDAVNPFESIRDDYRNLAAEAGTPFALIAIVCPDEELHRARVEGRRAERGVGIGWEEAERQKDYYQEPESAELWLDCGVAVDVNIARAVEAIDRLRVPPG